MLQHFQGQNYNIPVSVWILDSHPYHAPICFVKPTAEMQIKVSGIFLSLKYLKHAFISRYQSMLTKVDKYIFHIYMNGHIQNLISLVCERMSQHLFLI